MSYADEIFLLGGELEEVIYQLPEGRPQLFRVGVVDMVPKSIAHRILMPALQMPEPVRMMCREASLDTLLAEEKLEKPLKGDFPHCLDGAPLVLPCSGNQLRSGIDKWLDKHCIHPRVIAEFDDSALMKVFGQDGAGIYIAPAAIEAEVEWQYQVTAIGRVDEVTEHFYAISAEHRVLHAVVSIVLEAARESLFADESSWDESNE